MAKQFLATLLTDFGTHDAYVAAMKGVILRSCPRAQIVDISHEIPAHDVLAAAMVLAGAARYFPPETLHVVVVDPGVGTDRRILAGTFEGQTYLFPDNGVITMVAERGPAEELVIVRHPDFTTPRHLSQTFHGRDVFAPLAAEILKGLDIRRLGPQPETFTLLDLPVCEEGPNELIGQVMYVDVFGNLVSNIPAARVYACWADFEGVRGSLAGRDVGPIQGAYGFVEPGEPVMVINSTGLVEIAVNRGRACDVLQAGVGTVVRLTSDAAPRRLET